MSGHFTLSGGETISVSIYTRPASFSEPLDSKLSTLQALDQTGTIDELSVTTWPAKVPVSLEYPDTEASAKFEQFEEWAEATGVTIRPPFAVETTTSEYRDGSQTMLRTPLMSLAIYVNGGLRGVFPHTDGEKEYSVTEAIAALKTDTLRTDDTIREVLSTAWETECPDCGGTLVNVQGVQLCHDCAWNNWGAITDTPVTPGGTLRPAR